MSIPILLSAMLPEASAGMVLSAGTIRSPMLVGGTVSTVSPPLSYVRAHGLVP